MTRAQPGGSPAGHIRRVQTFLGGLHQPGGAATCRRVFQSENAMNTLKRPKARCLRHYLRGIPSQTARRNIRRLYDQRISAAGLGTGGMNRAKREILEIWA